MAVMVEAVDLVLGILKVLYATLLSFLQLFIPTKLDPVASKVVLITGAGRGIGRELAFQYGELGAVVVCVDLDEKLNNETLLMLQKRKVKAYAYTCNVGSRENVTSVAEKVLKDVGPVDVLINNAGILYCKRFLDHREDEINKIFHVNIIAHFWVLQAFLPSMVERGEGHVVAIASVAGLRGVANAAAYSTTKFAVRGLMESLQKEFSEISPNIRFTTVCPYFVDNGMCRTPIIRWSWLMDMLKTEDVVSAVISAQRRGKREISIPCLLRKGNFFIRLLPDRTLDAVNQLMGTGIAASDS